MRLPTLFCLSLLLGLILAAGAPVLAQETFAVAPFPVHGPEDYQYLSKGIPSVLTSNLSSPEGLAADEEAAPSEVRELSRSEAESFLQESRLDYLVYGEVTMMGEQFNVNVKVLDKNNTLLRRSAQGPVDDMIPAMKSVARDLGGQITGAGRAAEETTPSDSGERRDLVKRQREETREQPRETGQKNRSGLNPQFEQRQRSERQQKDRWQSRRLSFTAHDMRVGDADGDGRNEIFLLQDKVVKAYTLQQGELQELASYRVRPRVRFLNLNLLDTNENGRQELILSGLRDDNTPYSFVLGYNKEEFTLRQEKIRLFLNVVRIPPDYTRQLIGQKQRSPGKLKEEVHRARISEGDYQLGDQIDLPRKANVFNFAYLPQEQRHKILIADHADRLRVYSASQELQARTEDVYAGSDVGIPVDTSMPGLEESSEDPQSYYYIPTRLIPCNLDQTPDFEVIVNRSMGASRFFSRYRNYSEGEIHSLAWDGVGLEIVWKTNTIKGAVQDYGLADLNNDGTLDLFLCINTETGTFLSGDTKTRILAYPLQLDAKKRQTIFRPGNR